ncbi:MAG TPA: peptidoglycan-binding protein [Solirubrobacteraceae bacterium]|nr:peptidoglycan-binding protein [Solirubrobacteraceae bacterium]
MARKLVTVVVAAAIGGLLAPAPAAAQGAADVAALQVALRAVHVYDGSVDGVAGPATRAAIRRVQARRGLAVDGVAGAQTRRALGRRGRPRLGSRPLARRARGWDVAALQFLLARHGFPSGAVDGGLGPRSDAALRRFQAWAGLAPDGVAGAATVAALRRPAPRSPLSFRRPVAAAVGDRFGPRGVRFHPGFDFVAQARDPVWAARSGCVVSAGRDAGGYGKLVVLSHGLGVTSWYAHLSRIGVRRGACVAAGARIGAVGSTGSSTGPHLHFEVRLRGAAVDPAGSLR